MQSNLIIKPLITEKSLSVAARDNVYTFAVNRNANKDQIKAAIEKIYLVQVMRVNTLRSNNSAKKTGKKRMSTKVAPIKKAMIKLKKGQAIELFDLGGEK